MARQRLAAAHLSVDSALFVKRLMGIDMVSPVLALMDNVYYAHEQQIVDDHTIPQLVDAGLVSPDGVVDQDLASWMRVLAEPDIEVTLRAMEGDHMRRGVIARRGDTHVMALRRDEEVVVQSLWSDGEAFDEVVSAPLWAAMRRSKDELAPPAAEMESVTMPLEQASALAAASKPGDMVRALRGELGVDMRTARILNEVSRYGGQRCEIVMRENRGIETVDTEAGVFVADTDEGRVLSAVRRQGRRLSVTFGAGTYGRFRVAMADLTALTPSRNWFTPRVASTGVSN